MLLFSYLRQPFLSATDLTSCSEAIHSLGEFSKGKTMPYSASYPQLLSQEQCVRHIRGTQDEQMAGWMMGGWIDKMEGRMESLNPRPWHSGFRHQWNGAG